MQTLLIKFNNKLSCSEPVSVYPTCNACSIRAMNWKACGMNACWACTGSCTIGACCLGRGRGGAGVLPVAGTVLGSRCFC